jgi:hypothetical protein
MTRRTLGLGFRTWTLALCAAMTGAVALPAGATDRTVHYVVDPDQDCIDYSTVTVAVATRDVSDPYYAWSPGHSCHGIDNITWTSNTTGFELVFAGGGRKSVVDAVWLGSDPGHGDRSRSFTGLGSCNVHLTDQWVYINNNCDANDSECRKICVVTLHDIE